MDSRCAVPFRACHWCTWSKVGIGICDSEYIVWCSSWRFCADIFNTLPRSPWECLSGSGKHPSVNPSDFCTDSCPSLLRPRSLPFPRPFFIPSKTLSRQRATLPGTLKKRIRIFQRIAKEVKMKAISCLHGRERWLASIHGIGHQHAKQWSLYSYRMSLLHGSSRSPSSDGFRVRILLSCTVDRPFV